MDSMATDSGVVAVFTDTTIHLELQQFENYRLKNYSYSAAIISCSLFECEHGNQLEF